MNFFSCYKAKSKFGWVIFLVPTLQRHSLAKILILLQFNPVILNKPQQRLFIITSQSHHLKQFAHFAR